jgi:hypothetical protein
VRRLGITLYFSLVFNIINLFVICLLVHCVHLLVCLLVLLVHLIVHHILV